MRITLIKAKKLYRAQKIFLTSIISRNAYLLAASKSIQYEDVRGLGPLMILIF